MAKMKARVSDGEILNHFGNYKTFEGPGTRTSDSITTEIDSRDGIIQPMEFSKEFRKLVDAAGEHVTEVDKKYHVNPNLESRRGTSNIVFNTNKHNNNNSYAEKGEAPAILDFAQSLQKDKHDAESIRACKGKTPGFATSKDPAGAWANTISSGLGLIGGLTQYLDANSQKLNSPNIYASNPYERQALSTLAGLRDNPYQQLRAMQDVERRNRYATSQMGGITGAQKYYANVASNIGMQRNYADILAKSNAQNNAYKAQWANAAMTAGQANAARMQAANQYRDEAYAKAHAARQQQKQMGMFNMLNQVQQFYANEFKRRQFNKMYGLYAADLDLRKKAQQGDDVYIPTIPQGMLKDLPGITLSPRPNFKSRLG